MGKITVDGCAKHDYNCDRVKITVSFNIWETTTKLALDKVMTQCEEFLSILADNGIKIDEILLGDNSVENNYDDGENTAEAIREIIICTKFDMQFINSIMLLIKDKEYNADIDVKYIVSDLKQIHENLLREAVLDSKKKAMLIAESVGEKVVGIDSVENKDYVRSNMNWMLCETHCLSDKDNYDYSNRLKSPITTEKESVTVTWLVE